MERPKLPEGLVWREKPGGGYYRYIYFKKMYRGHDLRQSSKTSDPAEAKRRLDRKIAEIDALEDGGVRPKRYFHEGAKKLIEEAQVKPNTLLMYARQADLLVPRIGHLPLPIWKEDLAAVISELKARGASTKTVNLAIEFVRMVNRRACYYWKDKKSGLSWIDHCPIVPIEKGPAAEPYPLSWEQQEVFFDLLPGIKRKQAVVAVNTGLRDYPLVNLRWEWETYCEALGETVFEIPGEYMKNGKPMVLILNRVARREIESLRGRYPELVFGSSKPVTDKAWYRAWKEAGLPMGPERKKGVHNLRHTFGKRLRDAGVDERDVQDLLHHLPKSADVTRRYSAPNLVRLKASLEKIVPRTRLISAKLAQSVEVR